MQKGIGSSLYFCTSISQKIFPGLSPGKIFGLRMCKHKLEQTTFALATTSIQTRSHLQSCYPANKEAHFFLFIWAAVKIGKKCNLIF